MIASLSDAHDDVNIESFPKNIYHLASRSVGWNVNNSADIYTEVGIERNVPFISLGHELAHAYNAIIGGGSNEGYWYTEVIKLPDSEEYKSINLDEIFATQYVFQYYLKENCCSRGILSIE